MLSMVLLLLSGTFTSSAEIAPNVTINAPGTFDFYNGGFSVNGYTTMSLSTDNQFIAVAIAGKKVGSINKAVCIGCKGSPMNDRYLITTTKTPSGTKIASLSYNGTGAVSGNENYAYKDAFTIYYILVDAYATASSGSKIYYAYPNITVQT